MSKRDVTPQTPSGRTLSQWLGDEVEGTDPASPEPEDTMSEPDAPCSYKGAWGECRKWRDDPVHARPDRRREPGQHVWRNDRQRPRATPVAGSTIPPLDVTGGEPK